MGFPHLLPSPHDPTYIMLPATAIRHHSGASPDLPMDTQALQCAGAAPQDKDTASPTHLKECCDCAKRVPQHRGKVRHRLTLLAQLQQCILPSLGAGQLIDPLVDLFTVNLSQRCWHRLEGREENFSPNILSKFHPNPSHNLTNKQKNDRRRN